QGDRDLEAIVLKCLEADPAARYANAGDVLADLQARRAGRPVSPLRHRRAYRLSKFAKRNAIAVAVGAIAVVALGGAVGRILQQNTIVRRQLEHSYLLRAQQYAERGDFAAATALYAALDDMNPSNLAGANARAYMARIEAPVAVLPQAGPVGSLVFSPDGAVLAVPASNGVAFWDARTFLPTGRRLPHGTVVVYSADGARIATASTFDHQVRLWDGRTLAPVGESTSMPTGDIVPEFSADGRRLGVRCTGQKVVVLDATSGRVVLDLGSVADPMVTFSQRGGLMFLGGVSIGGIYEVASGRKLRDTGGVEEVAFSPDGRMLALVHEGGVDIEEARSGKRT
ncbi:MAG: hypothetical protein AAB368_07795, partial [bacterium]